MKKVLLLIALALAAGALFARWLLNDAGYVLIVHGGWEAETSLGFVLLALLVLLVAIIIVTLILGRLWNLLAPHHAGRRWRQGVARRRLHNGFLAFTEARYDKAERLFVAAAEKGDWPLAAWLGAARAAAGAGHLEPAQRYLSRAGECRGGSLPAGLMSARLAVENGDLENARQELANLLESWPKHPDLLALQAEVLERERDWDSLRELLPRLDAGTDAAQGRRERRLWLAMLERAAGQSADDAARRETLNRLWKDMPSRLRNDPALRARYSGYMAQLGDGREALKRVREGLEQDWDDRLPAVLDAIADVPPEKLLEQLEQWLQVRPGNGTLLLTAGRVALRARLWGKARSYFEAAARTDATARAELCRLLRALGEEEGARACMDDQLGDAARELPALPLPAAGERA